MSHSGAVDSEPPGPITATRMKRRSVQRFCAAQSGAGASMVLAQSRFWALQAIIARRWKATGGTSTRRFYHWPMAATWCSTSVTTKNRRVSEKGIRAERESDDGRTEAQMEAKVAESASISGRGAPQCASCVAAKGEHAGLAPPCPWSNNLPCLFKGKALKIRAWVFAKKQLYS
jgi:hypothetical protein